MLHLNTHLPAHVGLPTYKGPVKPAKPPKAGDAGPVGGCRRRCTSSNNTLGMDAYAKRQRFFHDTCRVGEVSTRRARNSTWPSRWRIVVWRNT